MLYSVSQFTDTCFIQWEGRLLHVLIASFKLLSDLFFFHQIIILGFFSPTENVNGDYDYMDS